MGQPPDSSLLAGDDAACVSESVAAEGSRGAAQPSGFARVEMESPGSVGNLAIARGSHRHSGKYYRAGGAFRCGELCDQSGKDS